MGSEDLFRKKKARKGAALERQKTERARSPRFLIVCEGTKTEPNYLKELVNDLMIRPQVVKIAPNNAVRRLLEPHPPGDGVDGIVAADVFGKHQHLVAVKQGAPVH